MKTYILFSPLVKVINGIKGMLNVEINILKFSFYVFLVDCTSMRVLSLIRWGRCTTLVVAFYFLFARGLSPHNLASSFHFALGTL